MKTMFYFLAIMLFVQHNAQSAPLPYCLKKLLKQEKYTFLETVMLPNNEKVHRIKINRPEKCMDCPSGTMYIDSLCQTVARFTVARAPNHYLKEGYERSWFSEIKKDKKIKEESSEMPNEVRNHENAYFQQFKNPVRYMIKTTTKNHNPLKLRKNDILEISLENGLKIFRKSKKTEQYKLFPETKKFSSPVQCAKAPCAPFRLPKSYFRWDHLGILIRNDSEMMVYDFDKTKGEENSGWKKFYTLEKISGK